MRGNLSQHPHQLHMCLSDLLWVFVSRQGIWLCGRLHRQHQRPGGHSALLRCRLHFHHFAAPHAAGRGKGVHQGPEKWGRPGAPEETSEERQAAPTDADGLGPACGPLPKPHYPCAGKEINNSSIWLVLMQGFIYSMVSLSPTTRPPATITSCSFDFCCSDQKMYFSQLKLYKLKHCFELSFRHMTNLFCRWRMQRRTVRSVTSWCLVTTSTSRQSTTPQWLKERSCCASPPHHTTRHRWCSTLSVRPVWVLLLRQKYLEIDFFLTNNPNTLCPVGLSSLEYIKQWIWLVSSALCLVG